MSVSQNQILTAEDYFIKVYQNYNIIGLGEGGHGLLNFHKFICNLLDNRKIREIVDVIIVEFANTDYQFILDKFILGEEVDLNDLRMLWRESTQPGRLGELPVYLELLIKMREINKSLPHDKKIRVIAGDPSIDWNIINNLDDYKKQISYSRETFPADLAIEYGIVQKRKVLIIYSEYHLSKISDNKIDPNYPTITSIINQKYPTAMKTIATIYSKQFLLEAQSYHFPLYSIVNLNHHDLGNLPGCKIFYDSVYKNDKEVLLFQKYKTRDLFDALLYIGQYDSLNRCTMPKPDFNDKYLEELNRRRKILGMNAILK